jgi:hypothetical protein
VLTDTGKAVAEILPNHRRDAFLALMKTLKEYWPDEDIRPLKYTPATHTYDNLEV